MLSKKILLIVILGLCALSCRSKFDTLLMKGSLDERYKAAFEYFNKEKYEKAATLFESLSVLTNNTNRDDTVQFYKAVSNYRGGDYYTAETDFDKFITLYPNSSFAHEARFLRLQCLYKQCLRYELDPKPTYIAISAINDFVKDYPKSEYQKYCFDMLKDLGGRIDKKAYMAALLYYRMEDYKAAMVAFKNIIKDDPTNIYREDVLYYLALSSYHYADMSVKSKQKERFLSFVDDYLNFMGEYPKSKYTKELSGLYNRVKKFLGNENLT